MASIYDLYMNKYTDYTKICNHYHKSYQYKSEMRQLS